MKIAIINNVNIDILPRFLENESLKFGYKIQDIYIAGFNQYTQEILNRNSKLYKFSPDILLFHLEGTALFEDVFFNQFSYSDQDLRLTIEDKVNELWQLVKIYSGNHPQTVIFLNTLVVNPFTIGGSLETNSNSSYLYPLYYEFNRNLIRKNLASNLSSLFILDWGKEIFYKGYSQMYDSRYWYLGRIPYSRYGIQRLSEKYILLLNSIKGKVKKVLILDLDNTLWGGIIGEDGLENIELSEDSIGKAYRDFQKLIKLTKDKGILLAIVSKNNLEDVKEIFKKHPFMILKEEDFISIKVNWGNKVQNIIEIARELNLGFDSFVFVDDNLVEREMVKSALPDVTVPDFPEDPACLVQWFSEISEKYFNKTSLTEEDKNRTKMYRAEKKRVKLAKKVATIEEFLNGLNMKIIIHKDHKEMINRLVQLTQRTNQFNLRTKRYTKNDLLIFIESKDCIVWDLELIDKFGTNGITGLIIVKLNRKIKEAFIDTFLMSCRIIGRDVEVAFVNYVALMLKKIGIKKLTGEYIPTKKNELVKDIYRKLGFQEEKNRMNLWKLNLIGFEPVILKYIKIEERYV